MFGIAERDQSSVTPSLVDLAQTSLIRSALMKVAWSKRFLRVLALFAMLLFVGDLMADSVAELCEMRCASETSESSPSNEKVPCHCTCAGHIGAVIATDFAMRLGSDLQPGSYLPGADEATPPQLAASIDHPPQLA